MDRLEKIQKSLKRTIKRLERKIAKNNDKKFVAKRELERYALKKEVEEKLEKFLTKEAAVRYFASKLEFDESMAYIRRNMFTEKDFLEHLHRFNDVLEEIRDMRRNRIAFEHRFAELDDTVDNHGKRIVKLEGKAGIL